MFPGVIATNVRSLISFEADFPHPNLPWIQYLTSEGERLSLLAHEVSLKIPSLNVPTRSRSHSKIIDLTWKQNTTALVRKGQSNCAR